MPADPTPRKWRCGAFLSGRQCEREMGHGGDHQHEFSERISDTEHVVYWTKRGGIVSVRDEWRPRRAR